MQRSLSLGGYPVWRLMKRSLSRGLHRTLDVFCPERCAACRIEQSSDLFCGGCAPDLSPVVGSVETAQGTLPAYAPFAYSDELVRAAIHRFKFEAHPELARRMAPLMLTALPATLVPELWVPVPLAIDKLPQRGYNQSALLAAELATETLSRSMPRLLRRSAGVYQQSLLPRAARLANAESAFSVAAHASGQPRSYALSQPQSVVLVDDVLTTGATARACCEALSQLPCRLLAVLTFAQVPAFTAPGRPAPVRRVVSPIASALAVCLQAFT